MAQSKTQQKYLHLKKPNGCTFALDGRMSGRIYALGVGGGPAYLRVYAGRSCEHAQRGVGHTITSRRMRHLFCPSFAWGHASFK